MKRNVKRHAVVQPLDQSYRIIPLTHEQNALVDTFLYDWLNEWNWHAQFLKARNCYYAMRREGKKLIFMHCQILDAKQNVDHENMDTLDNRGRNLRPANYSSNGANRPKQANNTSGYKCVFWRREKNFWFSTIKARGKTHYLGSSHDPAEMARRYDKAALHYFGEFARLNFPRSDYE